MEQREAFEAMTLGDKGERNLFLSLNQAAKDDRQQQGVYGAHTAVVPCPAPQPFLTASFTEADYNMGSSAGSQDNLFADEETFSPSPPTEGTVKIQPLLQSSEVAAELREKLTSRQGAATPPPPPPSQEASRTPVGKSQIFLTPKEKYAKEVSAERRLESVQRKVVFDLEASDLLQYSSHHEQIPEEEEGGEERLSSSSALKTLDSAEVAVSPVKANKIPLAFKILQAKKKMASQKKLILEHGEVRLTQQQRSRLKPLRKRTVRLARPVASASGPGDGSEEPLPAPDTPEHEAKRIFNRKDKLLAEHRSRQVPPYGSLPEPKKPAAVPEETMEISGPILVDPAVDLEKTSGESIAATELNCPFCSQASKGRKEHYLHVKVRIIN
jgi:hypothetical protein